jgi:dicarboxylate/amino acid:cation (Na+ or H+) symporter, DAACS family
VGVVYGVERVLDMSRTTLNVCGDLTAAVYVARTESDWDPGAINREATLAQAA